MSKEQCSTPRGDDDMLLNVYRDLMTGALVLVRNWFTSEPYCAQAEQLASQAICRAIAPRSETAASYTRIGFLHRIRSGETYFNQTADVIPLGLHETLNVYMKDGDRGE